MYHILRQPLIWNLHCFVREGRRSAVLPRLILVNFCHQAVGVQAKFGRQPQLKHSDLLVRIFR